MQMPSRTPSHCNFVLVAQSSPEEKDLERAKYCNCVITRRKNRNVCCMRENVSRYPTILWRENISFYLYYDLYISDIYYGIYLIATNRQIYYTSY